MRREFTIGSMSYGDKRVSAVELKCGRCNDVVHQPRGSTKTNVGPDEEAQRFTSMFERAGCFVGKRSADDRCPACTKRLGIDRPQRPVEPRNTVMREKMMAAVKEHVAAPTKLAPEPKEMSREDGRIIFAKIEDAYRDERHGYQNGWSDQKVATDLNVPRAWVEKVRKQFFGPEGSNEEIRVASIEARAYMGEAQALLDQCKALNDAATKLAARGELIQRRIDHIEKAVR